MNILLIPDKFKGSLSANQVIAAIRKGISKYGCQPLPSPESQVPSQPASAMVIAPKVTRARDRARAARAARARASQWPDVRPKSYRSLPRAPARSCPNSTKNYRCLNAKLQKQSKRYGLNDFGRVSTQKTL